MTISAPYNFVPVSKVVVTPREWADQVSHDLPFKDGICGSINYTLTAHTPLLIGGANDKDGDKTFFKLGQTDNDYAIPGSALRGMIRSVLEIASFSRMGLLDDTQMSVRDLTAPARAFYGDHITKTVGERSYQPKSHAGWLSMQGDHWILTRCEYSRVDHDDLERYSGNAWWAGVPRCSAMDKYDKWSHALDIDFTPGAFLEHPHSGGKSLVYSKAGDLGSGGTRGTLVFTGQPAAMPRRPHPKRSGKKHMEFIFHSEVKQPEAVPDSVMRGFLDTHKPRPEFAYKGEEWNYWKNQPRIPVFYLRKGNEIASMGLALMFRLPYNKTTEKALPDAHQTKTVKDMATLMFGRIDDVAESTSLRSRVSFETASVKPGTAKMAAPVNMTGSAPKPTFYPNYIRQADNKDRNNRQPYRTLMDDKAELRGWKRYPVRNETREDPKANDAMTTTLRPLDSGAEFEGRIVFHNLKPAELGALLWSLNWGGKTELRHSIGTGKPLGLGQVSLRIDETDFTINDGSPARQQEHYRDRFVDFMENQIRSWHSSPQIRALCGMAKPELAKQWNGGLKHLALKDDRGSNQFVMAKKENRVLNEYPGLSWSRPSRAEQHSQNDGPIIWRQVALSYAPGSKELSATHTDGDTARMTGDVAKAFYDGLSKNKQRKVKNRELAADITVEHTGGNTWAIKAIH